jgi:hypothetical protein
MLKGVRSRFRMLNAQRMLKGSGADSGFRMLKGVRSRFRMLKGVRSRFRLSAPDPFPLR